MALSELKPCPFCGSSAKLGGIRDGQQVFCTGHRCFARGPAVFHGPGGWEACERDAIAAWNTRALLDAARAEQKEDAEPVAVLDGKGWVYFGPDVGIEYAPEHPVDSGETPDATDVRRSTYFEDWLVGENQKLDGKVRELAVAHPPRAEQPVLSREAVYRVLRAMALEILETAGGGVSIAPDAATSKALDAILALASPGGEQEAEGWRLVPYNPTEEMLGASEFLATGASRDDVVADWQAMVLASPVRGAGEKDATDLYEAVVAALVEGEPTLGLQGGQIWIGDAAFDARAILSALAKPPVETTAMDSASRAAIIQAIALLDVAIAGTVFTKPDAGRVIVNVAKAQAVLDGLRAAIAEETRLEAPAHD